MLYTINAYYKVYIKAALTTKFFEDVLINYVKQASVKPKSLQRSIISTQLLNYQREIRTQTSNTSYRVRSKEEIELKKLDRIVTKKKLNRANKDQERKELLSLDLLARSRRNAIQQRATSFPITTIEGKDSKPPLLTRL